MKKIIKKESDLKLTIGSLYHPPLIPMPDIPVANHYGAFLTKRKFDVHTGVDLACNDGSPVYAIEDGEIVVIRKFTGEHAGTPFWENTWAIDIEGMTGTICYGEVDPNPLLKVGDIARKGEKIGTVKRVLKEFKGKPMSMLHLAIHNFGWKYLYKDQQNPSMESFYDLQKDPTMLLIQLKNMSDIMEFKDEFAYQINGLRRKINGGENE